MLNPELKMHLRSLTRVVYYVTDEEDRVISDINDALKKNTKSTGTKVFVFNPTMGLLEAEQYIRNLKTRVLGPPPIPQPNEAFDEIYQADSQDKKLFYIILDPERWMTDATSVRRFLNIILQMKLESRLVKNIIFVGSRLVMAHKLQPYVHVVRDKGLNEDEIQEVLSEVVSQMADVTLPPNSAPWFKGLNSYEVESAVSQSVIRSKKGSGGASSTEKEPKRIDKTLVNEYKRSRIQKSDLIEIIDCSDMSFDKVGGADRFKKWVEETRYSWTKEGQDYGLRPPKGVLCVGVWGCGKSISVKSLGNSWNLPVIQLELGKLRSSAVGTTEDNVYKITDMIEALSPCIVWVDEAEKSFSGAHSSSYSDSGVTSRMLGILSTWHAETKAEVCLAMTANSLKTLPVEFINRIEDRFFFDVPTQEVRMEIIKIHLANMRNPMTPSQIKELNLVSLAKAADNLVPREMGQALEAALRRSFSENKPGLDEDVLLEEFKTRPRILRTMDEELKSVLDWVGWDPDVNEGVRARFASSKQSNNTMAILKGGKQ